MAILRKIHPAGAARAVPALLRQINTRRVLDALWQAGAMSRAELSRRTGLSAPTMSRLVLGLHKAGLLERAPGPRGGMGRPTEVYRPATRQVQVVGAVVGRQVCQVIATGIDGRMDVRRCREFSTPGDYDALLAGLADAVQAVRRLHGVPCLGVGLSLPGLIQADEERMVFSPNLHFMDGRQPGRDLERRIRLPVVMRQEEHGFCLAERMFGAARGVQDFVVVDISDGFGMGVVSGGRLITGGRGFGGEVGHMTVEREGEPCGCGNRGCLETVATDFAFVRLLSRRIGRVLGVEAAVRAVAENRLAAEPDLTAVLDALALGVGAVINIFNPALVLVHGRLFDIRASLVEDLAARVRRHALRPSLDGCRIARATVDKRLGAIAAVLDRF